MLSTYQLLIVDFCNIPISNVKKLVSTFLIKKSKVINKRKVLHYENF